MKRAAMMMIAALAATLAANAAPVRTATEGFVTNKIAEAVSALPAPDYSATNAALVATIEAVAPAPGNYSVVSNAAMSAVQTNAEGVVEGGLKVSGSFAQGSDAFADGSESHAEGNLTNASGDYSHAEGNQTDASGDYSHAEGSRTAAWGSVSHAEGYYTKASGQSAHADGYRSIASNSYSYAWQGSDDYLVVSPYGSHGGGTYNLNPVGGLSGLWIGETNMAGHITAAIRAQSLGGIWDEALQVWWTPRMVGGSLTYHATTNVNLNAEATP